MDGSSYGTAISEKTLKGLGLLGLSGTGSIDGSRVLLKSPGSASDDIQPTPSEPTTIELVDDTGTPIANHPYRILLDGGGGLSGMLDENGRAEIDLDGSARIVFPGLADVGPG